MHNEGIFTLSGGWREDTLVLLVEMKLYLNRAVVYNDFKILHLLEMRNQYE